MLDYLLENPRRLRELAQALVSAAGFMLLAGMAGLVARTAVGVVQHASPPTLAALFPTLWTWWVPETFIGALPALFLMVVGMWLTLLARRLQRVYCGR